MEWADFLDSDINLGKLKVTLITIGWAFSEMGEGLWIMGLLNQVCLTNDLMSYLDRLNDFCMLIVIRQFLV